MEKIGLIYGGKSFEHDVSIKSKNSVINNINKKYDVSEIYVDKDGNWYKDGKLLENIIEYLKELDIVFPLIHGNIGEDGKLQGLLETFNIKYVGSNTISSALAMDKGFCKTILDKYNIKQVPYIIVNKKSKIKEIIEKFTFPVIIKPANGGSSIGISVANNTNELIKALSNAFKYDKKVIVEKFIKARELEVGIINNNGIITSSVGEIKSNGFYDYEAKYIKNTEVIVDTNLKKEIILKIKETARNVFKILECNDFARCDFLYDETSDELYFNEINTIPGFTEISMFPKLFIHDGYTYTEILDILIKSAKKKFK